MKVKFRFFPTQIVRIKPNIKWGGQIGQISKCAIDMNGVNSYQVCLFDRDCSSDWFIEGFLEIAFRQNQRGVI
jgi:hypothetical protein